jgi:hypothetical protein
VDGDQYNDRAEGLQVTKFHQPGRGFLRRFDANRAGNYAQIRFVETGTGGAIDDLHRRPHRHRNHGFGTRLVTSMSSRDVFAEPIIAQPATNSGQSASGKQQFGR